MTLRALKLNGFDIGGLHGRARFYSHSALIVSLIVLAGCAKKVHAQVPVAMAPPIHFQFLNASGNPLALGKVYTYAAGTTTLQNTYVDSTGTTQNPDPILLDSTGSPSNGSTQTGIFLSNLAWKFVAFDLNNVQQWSVDNVTTYFALTNSANTWTATQTFTQAVVITQTDNQLIFGSGGNQTTLDFAPPAGNITVHGPAIAETLVGKADIVSGVAFSNGCGMTNGPGTYVCIANQNPTGTQLNGLVKLTNAPSQGIWTGITDTGGAIGICVGGCGNTGTATIQQSGGPVTCSFDGSVTAGDYVQISPTLGNGACHDAGATYPATGQVLGRTLSTAVGVNNYPVMLFGPELHGAFPTVVYSTPSASTAASIASTSMAGPSLANHSYRFSYYIDQTLLGAGCTGNTTIAVNLVWSDPNAVGPSSILSNTFSIINNGTVGSIPAGTITITAPITVRQAVSAGPNYFTTYTLGATCTTSPQYQIFPVLEQLN